MNKSSKEEFKITPFEYGKALVLNSNTVVFEDTKIHYFFIDNKSKKNLVIIPGFNSSSFLFLYFATHFTNANIYIIDLPGYGKSKVKDLKKIYGINWFSAQIVLLLKKLQLKNLYILGHSMGGYIASLVSNELKQKNELILVSPVCEEIFNLPNPSDIMFLFLLSAEEVKKSRELLYFKKPMIAPFLEKLIFQTLAKKNVKKIGFNLGIMLMTIVDAGNGDIHKSYKQNKGPVHLFWGRQDSINFFDNYPKVLRTLPKETSVIKMNNTGHNPITEHPVLFANYLNEILLRNDG